MKVLFDKVSIKCSKVVTRAYSTSFSLGIHMLGKNLRDPIYSIYGFVRLADEIVDSFHGFQKKEMLDQFQSETFRAIEQKISINPILNAFQESVNRYHIDSELTYQFFNSMHMDLEQKTYNQKEFDRYVLGSAEVVGLMCLKVFVANDPGQYEKLKPYAQKLGSAFQKVNFLRDLHADYSTMQRSYFPGIDPANFSPADKLQIENEIEQEFTEALDGIKMLPPEAGRGVFLAYCYYRALFNKIKSVPSESILKARIRISNFFKILLLVKAWFTYRLHNLNIQNTAQTIQNR